MLNEAILKKINNDQIDDSRTDLYRYNSLLEAIRYFSNPLTLEQITDVAFDCVNEILTVEKSVMYILENGRYKAKKQRGLDAAEEIALNAKLSGFALYVGNVISGELALEQYFDASVLKSLDATVMIPLILHKNLYGFFLLSRRITGSFNANDMVVCETLMNLFNNAIESCQRLEDLQISNRELDEKIFNLFAINQSAKAMLTEHRLDELFKLAVDVFSELTQSRNTGFVVYDKLSEKYILKAYRDVFATDAPGFGSLTKRSGADCFSRQILDLSNASDRKHFDSLFLEGSELLSSLKTHYVVFICDSKRELLGFVTLGETVTETPYKKGSFELVESLAAYTFIALSNALLLQKVSDQKKLLQNKINRLVKLNCLSKNITSAFDSKSLMELTIETLCVSFGVESAFIALYNAEKDILKVEQASDSALTGIEIPMNNPLQPIKQGRIIFESSSENLHLLTGDEIAGAISSNSGALVIPLTLDRYETLLVGALFIFKLNEEQLSDEENVLTFETIANQMAPLLEGFTSIERQKKLYKRDMAAAFVIELERQIKECTEFDFDMEIIRIKDNSASPFKGNTVADLLYEASEGVYPVSYDITEIIVTQDFSYNYSVITSALAGCDVSVSRFRFRKDFSVLEDYLAL